MIEVERIDRQISGDSRFCEKLFTAREIGYCRSYKVGQAQHFAARFAAKEAFFKALGTGYRGGITFRDIEIINDDLGKPEIVLSGAALTYARRQGFQKIHLSLSHLKAVACAMVIIEQ